MNTVTGEAILSVHLSAVYHNFIFTSQLLKLKIEKMWDNLKMTTFHLESSRNYDDLPKNQNSVPVHRPKLDPLCQTREGPH